MDPFQSCVTEFDLNLFEHSENQAAPLIPSHGPQKKSYYRIRERLKMTSHLIEDFRVANKRILELETKLVDSKKELEEQIQQTFSANENLQLSSEKRDEYLSKLTKISTELAAFKEQHKNCEHNLKVKEKIINGYSEQVKGMKTTIEQLRDDHKQKNKTASLTVKQLKAQIAAKQKKFHRFLKGYYDVVLCPPRHNCSSLRDIEKEKKWMESIVQQNLKLTKSGEVEDTYKGEVASETETNLDDEETKTNAQSLHNNISSDFENVGSVDTGRGSSLALSDVDKSFSSPEYYMTASPFCNIPNTTFNQCNVTKSDAATSPISPDKYDSPDISTTSLCKKCTLTSKRDACTSPVPLQSVDAATNTSDELFKTMTPRKYFKSNIEVDANMKQTEINVSNISQTTPTPYKKDCGHSEILPKHMVDVSTANVDVSTLTAKDIRDTVDSDDGKDLVSNDDEIASPVKEQNISSPIQFDKVVNNIQIIFSDEVPTVAAKSQDDKGFDVDYLQDYSVNQSLVEKTLTISPRRIEAASIIQPETEAHSSPVKLQNNIQSEIGDGEVMPNVSQIKKSHVFSPIDFEDNESNCSNIANDEPPIIIKSNINRNTHQELECLELNNSNNCSNDVEIDTEVRTILDKIRLRYRILSPIPPTPPGQQPTNKNQHTNNLQSPGVPSGNRNTMPVQRGEVVTDSIHDQMNLIRTNFLEALVSHIPTWSKYMEPILRKFSGAGQNDELFRNFISNLNRNYEKQLHHENENNISASNEHVKSNNKHQPYVVDLDTSSVLCMTETNENEDSTCNDYTNMVEDSEIEDQTISNTSSNQLHDGICTQNKEISHVHTKNKMSDGPILKSEQSHVVACLNSNYTADSSLNSNNDVQAICDNTHYTFESNVECDDNTSVSVDNSNTAASSSVVKSKNSIVYESVDISDAESDTPTLELENSVESCMENSDALSKRRGKLKKKSKLEAFKLKLLPKNKIKNDNQTKAVKKLQYKPVPKLSPKRQVTKADTAASLNDKSVYENAVKVVAALRSSKVPRVIVEDCELRSKNITEKKNTVENKIENSSNPHSLKERQNNKRKLTENLVPEDLNDSNKLRFSDTKKGKITDTQLNENISEKSPNKPKQKTNDISPQKRSFSILDVEKPNTKRTQEVVHTSDSSETKEPKRKRTSVSDRKTPPGNIKSNDKILVPYSSRILRSSTQVKHNKEAIKDTPIVVKNCESLRSKVNQNEPQTCDNTSVLSLAGTPRLTRQRARSISESMKIGMTSESNTPKKNNNTVVCYADLDLFSNKDTEEEIKTTDQYTKSSFLCQMIEKYGVQRKKFIAKQAPEPIVTGACQRLETSLSDIVDAPSEVYLSAMKKLVVEVRTWQPKHFVLGLMKFLRNPERKMELFSKSNCPPFPPMTKKDQVLLYVLDELQKSYEYRNVVQKILLNIEYNLLAINKAAETFDVIETMSHFYALLCRSYQKISQLRVFIIDAMYCLQYKSVILVQQCLEVWMSVLPLGHMGLAKCPMVTCLVYLLHFYKCEDKFNRVQEIRKTLRWKYNYDMHDWNESMILDMFRTAIIEVRDTPIERKTLRLALLILAKRNGAKWCHNMIVINMLQPLINDSSTNERTKRFCVSLLGPLLKPYPSKMKVHYEMVIDYLMGMLKKKNSQKMQEAIISSLIYVDRNNIRLYQFLCMWTPQHVSLDFELVFRDYVRSKPVPHWKKILSWKM